MKNIRGETMTKKEEFAFWLWNKYAFDEANIVADKAEELFQSQDAANTAPDHSKEECPDCKGTGQDFMHLCRCKTCNGTGRK